MTSTVDRVIEKGRAPAQVTIQCVESKQAGRRNVGDSAPSRACLPSASSARNYLVFMVHFGHSVVHHLGYLCTGEKLCSVVVYSAKRGRHQLDKKPH